MTGLRATPPDPAARVSGAEPPPATSEPGDKTPRKGSGSGPASATPGSLAADRAALTGEAVSAGPAQAAAEADTIRRGIGSLRWLLNNAHNHDSAHWANFRQGGEDDAQAGLAGGGQEAKQ